ncbi:hypothetical protein BGM26_05165 [Bacillus sp. FJAT-29790]|uniref:hypothetical protein n=1 Tax=Bacillus sp. FJAT-29790 TaxID=1895002 RepID=UPI001C215D79|nr:hypothetical protein [Bacillus sp. FJAT-29790]MBU8878377.1 hypothetical protein [Bacillus sp. FJAT-29790]
MNRKKTIFSSDDQKEQQMEKDTDWTYPYQNNYPGDSKNEHRTLETANVLIGESEIGQQNENL